MKRIFFIIVLFTAALFAGCVFSAKQTDDNFFTEKKSIAGRVYVFYRQKNPNVRFTLTRPQKDDEAVVLSVPGTYTSPQNIVEGFVILNGKIIQDKERQGWDGAVIFEDGAAKIIQTENGRLLTREQMKEIAKTGASLMQAHLLVYENSPQPFKPQPMHQRRALAVLRDNSPGIVESESFVTLSQFAQDLAKLNIQDAVNLDMGTWSEGWYRDPDTGKIMTIGLVKDATNRQTNWIVLQKVTS